MTPLLAFGLSVILIVYLIRRDCVVTPRPSPAVWIPTLWLVINGSRQVSQWLGTGIQIAGERLHEGALVDQAVYGLLILLGILVIANRNVQISRLARNNWWIILFFLYEGISAFWSDFPFISFKRWIKASGDIVMVLVLCSDPHPVRAIVAALKRSGYVLIPLSVLLCKYYDDMGRVIDNWGRSYYTGVTLDKNMFGYLLFAFGLFFASAAVHAFRQNWSRRPTARTDFWNYALLLVMVAWLTPLANSKTSFFMLVCGVLLILALQFSKIKRNLWSFMVVGVLIGATFNALFSVESVVLEASGRDSTLTGRTGIWQTVLSEPINPLLGTGYASFWLGDRLQRMWDLYPNTPLLQAHNGYIEVYLNLGLIGVALLVAALFTGLRNAKHRLLSAPDASGSVDDDHYTTLGTAYVLTYLVYNITEATFMGLNFLFILFLVLGWDFQRNRVSVSVPYIEQEERPQIAAS